MKKAKVTKFEIILLIAAVLGLIVIITDQNCPTCPEPVGVKGYWTDNTDVRDKPERIPSEDWKRDPLSDYEIEHRQMTFFPGDTVLWDNKVCVVVTQVGWRTTGYIQRIYDPITDRYQTIHEGALEWYRKDAINEMLDTLIPCIVKMVDSLANKGSYPPPPGIVVPEERDKFSNDSTVSYVLRNFDDSIIIRGHHHIPGYLQWLCTKGYWLNWARDTSMVPKCFR